jgi:hypothetical protein
MIQHIHRLRPLDPDRLLNQLGRLHRGCRAAAELMGNDAEATLPDSRVGASAKPRGVPSVLHME